MVKRGKEFSSKTISSSPIFSYIPEKDKYLCAVDKPKYKFNIIGVGLMGMEHMRTTMSEGRATINGIFDINPQSIEVSKGMYKALYHLDLKIYESLEDACNDSDVDGLIISTPNFTHIDIIRVAIKSGKHILLEKPMATTIEDAYEIWQIAKNYNAVFQLGLQYRYKSMYVEAINEALERKSLGEIKLMNILEHRIPFLDKVKQWNKFSEYSGQTLVEKCCHYFDLFNLFAQSKPKEIFAIGDMAVNFKEFEYEGRKSDIYDNAFVTIIYENGIRANFNLCMFAPMFYEEIILVGEEGRIMAYEKQDFLDSGTPKSYFELLRGENKPSKIITPLYPSHIGSGGHSGATFFEHIYFIDAIEGKETTTATAEEGFWSIVIGSAAQESIKRRKLVIVSELLKEKGISL